MHNETARKRLGALLDYETGRTQGWLADRLGIKQQTVSSLIRGDKLPSFELALVIHRVTGIPPQAWLTKNQRARIDALQPLSEAA